MTRAFSVLAAIVGAATDASAQYTATYQIMFASDAPGTIGSGTNAITVPHGAPVHAVVSVLIDPDIGALSPIGPVWGIADGGFTLSGSGVAGLGSWGNLTVPAPYNFLYGIATTSGTVAGYNVHGAIWGTGGPWVLPVPTPPGPITNPDDVWSGTFTASLTNTGTLNFTFTGLAQTNVWMGYPGTFPLGTAFQNVPGPGGSITIIPAPAGIALLGLGGVAALRRRRMW